MIPKVQLTDKADPDVRNIIVQGLRAFNAAATGLPADPPTPLVITLSHPETGAAIGGLWGYTALQHLFIELLFVPEALRGEGWGSTLMKTAEAEAVERGCTGIWLDTFSFQARGFYERLGYRVFGELDDFPPRHSRFFLTKRLPAP